MKSYIVALSVVADCYNAAFKIRCCRGSLRRDFFTHDFIKPSIPKSHKKNTLNRPSISLSQTLRTFKCGRFLEQKQPILAEKRKRDKLYCFIAKTQQN